MKSAFTFTVIAATYEIANCAQSPSLFRRKHSPQLERATVVVIGFTLAKERTLNTCVTGPYPTDNPLSTIDYHCRYNEDIRQSLGRCGPSFRHGQRFLAYGVPLAHWTRAPRSSRGARKSCQPCARYPRRGQ